MAQDVGFWTWPVDVAATQSRSRGLAVIASVLYGVGAVLLLSQMLFALPVRLAEIGVASVLLGMAGSIVVVCKVLMTRSRLVADR